jgi:hypothetical protein
LASTGRVVDPVSGSRRSVRLGGVPGMPTNAGKGEITGKMEVLGRKERRKSATSFKELINEAREKEERDRKLEKYSEEWWELH